MTAYRLRLRELLEDFALVGRPRTYGEMFKLWEGGLRDSEWGQWIEELRYDSVGRRRWSHVETIYAMERVFHFVTLEPMIQQMTFILKNEGTTKFPDFRTWNTIGPLYVYAHDELADHTAWNTADAFERFFWFAVYQRLILPPSDFNDREPNTVGMQIGMEPTGNPPTTWDGEDNPEDDPEDDFDQSDPEEERIREREQPWTYEEVVRSINENRVVSPVRTDQVTTTDFGRSTPRENQESVDNTTNEVFVTLEERMAALETTFQRINPPPPNASSPNKRKRMTARGYFNLFKGPGSSSRGPDSTPDE